MNSQRLRHLGLAALLFAFFAANQVAAQNTYAGYLFVYFKGEGSSNGEQIRFAVSSGSDPTKWTALNGGNPILTSNLGTKGVRDPSIIRTPDNIFHVIATDLCIYCNNNWDISQRKGSRQIILWDSCDLVNWTPPRSIQLSPHTAGNTWAPSAMYDKTSSSYLVFWASKIYAENDPNHTAGTHQRVLLSTTKDFYDFTPAQTFIDTGYSVIDTEIVQTSDGTYHRFSKDERGRSSSVPDGKYPFQESSKSINGPWKLIASGIGKGSISQGEGPALFESITTPGKWYMFIDEYGGKGYQLFETSDISSGRWTLVSGAKLPDGSRHGSVIPITATEMAALQSKWK